ncbi:hypothetical protein ACFL0A_01385 [Patescibacteria group bacterium]
MINQFLKSKLFYILFCFVLFSIPFVTEAVTLYLEPSQGEYQPGDTFGVEIKIDTKEECINAIEANLSFSQILKTVDFSQGQSIITLWVNAPEINQEKGLISFVGGIPGGYCGRIPGDPEASNLLGKIIFKIPSMMVGELKENLAELKFLDTSQVFLNDGLGTRADLSTQGATLEIVSKRSEPLEEDWYEEIKKDTISPEPLEIEVNKTPEIFEGKYFITFFTIDKQTGLDFYEVKEEKEDWKESTSPYLLKDQNLKSIIKVRAVDKAGNERIAEYVPEVKIKTTLYLTIIIILIGLGIILWLFRRLKMKSVK